MLHHLVFAIIDNGMGTSFVVEAAAAAVAATAVTAAVTTHDGSALPGIVW